MVQAALLSRDAGVTAESEGEVFDTYTEDGTPLGRELRSVCHAKGIWHRAVYALLFNSAGELLIQRRSPDKKVAPGQWDLSVAEHLSPGESYAEGVARGLEEELGVTLTQDNEFIEVYRLDGYDGPIAFNHQEVTACRWVSLAQLRSDMAAQPQDYTVWFREEMAELDFFGVGRQ
eukprot:XP_001694229.1 predicted protein [Chlamydomonas reinhardtii]